MPTTREFFENFFATINQDPGQQPKSNILNPFCITLNCFCISVNNFAHSYKGKALPVHLIGITVVDLPEII